MNLLYVQCTCTYKYTCTCSGTFYMYNVHLVRNLWLLQIKNSHLILTDSHKFFTFDHCMLHDKCMYIYFIVFFIF